MTRQNLYVAVFNAFLGVIFSLLLKGNLLIYVLTFIMVGTIVFIEHKWVYEKVFRRRKWRAVAGYAVFVLAMAGFLILITRPNRDVALIVKSVHGFLDHLRPGEYDQAYEALSQISKKNYPLPEFLADHEKNKAQVQDFRIDQITLNEFDKKKAVVRISSPFSIYGQNNLAFEMVSEDEGWHVVMSPSMARPKTLVSEDTEGEGGARKEKKRREGKVTHFFKSIF